MTDASGGVFIEAHDMAIRRMVQAGVTPISWRAVLCEWQRDWARTETLDAFAEALVQHGGGSGIAFHWEMQLLGSKAKAAGHELEKNHVLHCIDLVASQPP